MSFTLYPTEPNQRKSTDKTTDLLTFIQMSKYLNRHLIDAMESLGDDDKVDLAYAINELNQSIIEYNDSPD